MLERVGVPIEVRPADVDEEPLPGEAPGPYVARVARDKAHAVTRLPGQWVLAADTTVTLDGDIDDKPFHEDVSITSDVAMIELSAETLADYVASGDWRGKAGAYALQ